MDSSVRIGLEAINLLFSTLFGLTAGTALYLFIYRTSWKRVTMLCTAFGSFLAVVCFVVIEYTMGG